MLSKKQIYAAREEYEKNYDEHMRNLKIETQCVHAGQCPEMLYGSVAIPIYQTTTYKQEGKGVAQFSYSRLDNPTKFALERNLGILHNAAYSKVWGSGSAGVSGIINLLENGDECICMDELIGSTHSLFTKIMTTKGIKFKLLSFDDISKVLNEITPKTKMVYMESATNPRQSVPDIKAIVDGVKSINKNIIVVVDNTFLSPINFKPLELGVDIVIESITKYINGHSDVTMGLTVTNNKEIYDKLSFISVEMGGIPSPFDCFLVCRGIKTLFLRINQINKNALAIAQYLEKNDMVEEVMYPGLERFPYYQIAKKQFKGFGGIVSFIIKGGMDAAVKLLNSVKVFCLASSLGGVESLIEHPASMTHVEIEKSIREAMGITDGLIRMSIGIENQDDLINDLEEAFKLVKNMNK